MSARTVGAPLPERTYVLTQEKINRYSRYALEGRDTPNIHTDATKAKQAGLPGPVAHGRHPVAFFSEAMLREYGNLSSAFVYFVLDAALSDGAPDGWWWLSSFGAGFSCHGALLKVQR